MAIYNLQKGLLVPLVFPSIPTSARKLSRISTSQQTNKLLQHPDRRQDQSATILTHRTMHPSRAAFLATGLVPVIPDSTSTHQQAEAEDCPICFCPLTHPVRTPCNHTFDRACLTTWLSAKTNTKNNNTCPLCKTALFRLSATDPPTRSLRDRPTPARQQQLATALRTSNLLSRAPPFANFGSTEYNLSALQRSIAQATFSLERGRARPGTGEWEWEWVRGDAAGSVGRVVGPCVLDLQTLSPALVAMGNLLPAVAEAEGRGFAGGVRGGWEVVCCALWAEIQMMRGRKADAMVLPCLLRMRVRDLVTRERGGVGVEVMVFFERGGVEGECFELLLEFLAFRAWERQQEVDKRDAAANETKRLRREAMEEPKMQSKCAVM